MKRFLPLIAIIVLIALIPSTVQGQNPWSSAAMQAWKQSVTLAGFMGAPRYTTALLPTCNAANQGALVYDTTLNGLYVCVPSTWTAAGGTGISLNTAQTPDSMYLATDALSNAFILAESADSAFDFAHAQSTDPTLFIHSRNQSTTQWLSLKHDGTNGVIGVGAGALNLSGASGNSALSLPSAGGMTLNGLNGGLFIINTGTGSPFPRIWVNNTAKALTAGAATSFVQIAVPSGDIASGVVEYVIRADDGTDFQARTGALYFTAVNKAGTETCTLARATGGTTVDNTTDAVAVSAGTLTNTFTCSTSPTNAVDIQANAASSLTETTLNITYQIRKNGGLGAITAQ